MHPSAIPQSVDAEPETLGPAATCLNCGVLLAGSYCAACGQQAIDLTAPTWHVVKQALEDATDVNGRVLCTARALGSPGRLTIEFLRGRRTPYLGPLKLFLLAGTVLTTTWIVTRGVDAHYYGMATDRAGGAYIDSVVRGFLAASVAIAGSGWALGRRRHRFLDEAVFAIHLVAALALLATASIWVGTAWKLVWGTAAATSRTIPSLLFLVFLPASVLGFAYTVFAVRRVYGGRWWATALRALLITVAGILTVTSLVAHAA